MSATADVRIDTTSIAPAIEEATDEMLMAAGGRAINQLKRSVSRRAVVDGKKVPVYAPSAWTSQGQVD